MKPFLVLFFVGLLLGGLDAWAQTSIEEDLPTRKVNKKVKENKKSNFPEEKSYRYIYVKDGGKVLFGNPCAMEVTHKMGFEYGIEHRPERGLGPWWRRFSTNTTTKTILFFTKGPWWRATVTKRFKACAMSSGDRRG